MESLWTALRAPACGLPTPFPHPRPSAGKQAFHTARCRFYHHQVLVAGCFAAALL